MPNLNNQVLGSAIAFIDSQVQGKRILTSTQNMLKLSPTKF